MSIERELDERIERYLDGELPTSESFALERELVEPAAAAALGAALFLREALRESGPTKPPAGLEERILQSLALRPATTVHDPERARGWSAARSAAEGLLYAWRGPAMAASGLSAGGAGTRGTLAGLSAARWALGPLAPTAAQRPEPEESAPAPWWRRLLRRREAT